MCGSNLEIRQPEGTPRACPAEMTSPIAFTQFESATLSPETQMTISTPLNFQLGSGFWACIPQQSCSLLLGQYAARAKKLLPRHSESQLNDGRLQLIVEAAMEARQLYFVAALQEPTTGDLDRYFDLFVICSVFGIPNFNEAPYGN
jgi:hypothetical protein